MSLSGVLTEYSNTPPEMRDYRKKDGVLVTVAVIAKVPHVYVCTVCMYVCMYVYEDNLAMTDATMYVCMYE